MTANMALSLPTTSKWAHLLSLLNRRCRPRRQRYLQDHHRLPRSPPPNQRRHLRTYRMIPRLLLRTLLLLSQASCMVAQFLNNLSNLPLHDSPLVRPLRLANPPKLRTSPYDHRPCQPDHGYQRHHLQLMTNPPPLYTPAVSKTTGTQIVAKMSSVLLAAFICITSTR